MNLNKHGGKLSNVCKHVLNSNFVARYFYFEAELYYLPVVKPSSNVQGCMGHMQKKLFFVIVFKSSKSKESTTSHTNCKKLFILGSKDRLFGLALETSCN